MSFAKQTPATEPAAANPEDILYLHINRAEALRQQLADLADAYQQETATIEALENQLRAARGETPITTDLNHILFQVTSVDYRTLPVPPVYPS